MGLYGNDRRSRAEVVGALRTMAARGLNQGSSGNVSVRIPGGMLVTPTGLAPDTLVPEQVVAMGLDGEIAAGECTPSSEWRMHADLYRARPEVHAIVHCHSPYAAILACARREIPAMHYMVAGAGGTRIPLADYATFGTAALSRAALDVLQGVSACLLANHGQLALGPDLPAALKLASLVEEMAHCYWGTLAIGGPHVLSEGQMEDVLASFATYGQQAPAGGS